MNEQFNSFIEKLSSDEELQQRLSVCKTPEEAYQVASEHIDGISLDEFTKLMTELNTYVQEELTVDDLLVVAGGTGTDELEEINFDEIENQIKNDTNAPAPAKPDESKPWSTALFITTCGSAAVGGAALASAASV